MSGRTRIALVLAGALVIAGGVGLAIAVRSPEEAPAPRATPKGGAETAAAPRPAMPERPAAAPVASAPPGGYQKFPKLMGKEAKPFGTDPAKRTPIPDGGFAAWTGREGTWPGEMEAFASEAKIPIGVALEQRRSTLLEERTGDPNVLAEILGGPPGGNQLAVIGQQANVLHEATASIQVQVREGKLDEAAAIRATRAAQDAYRATYEKGVGLTPQQFDQFFAPSRPFP